MYVRETGDFREGVASAHQARDARCCGCILLELGVRLIGLVVCLTWLLNFITMWTNVAEATMEEGFGEHTLLACLEAGTMMPLSMVAWLYICFFRKNNYINRAKLPYAQAIFLWIWAADDLLYFAVVFDYKLYGH